MYHLVDWLSFTVASPIKPTGEANYLDPQNIKIVRRQVLAKVYQKVGKLVMDTLFSTLPMNEESGRFPYRYSVVDETSNAHIFFDPNIDHILVEISGRGAKLLQEQGLVQMLCADISTSCTRIDVSADLHVDTSPVEFVSAGYDKHFASTSIHTSQSGTTCYVGSPKSDRRACVYRYNDPHPRAPYLRVEHRFRRERAQQMAVYIHHHGIAKGVQMAGEVFGWRHPIWEPAEIELAAMPRLNVDARSGPFVNWILKQVFPAMRRAEREGVIDDLKGFVQVHLFDDDDT